MTNPMAEALGWALFHFLWQGAALGIALAVALCFCRTARVRYLLACGAMAAMVVAFAATLAICWPAGLPHHKIAGAARSALALPPAPDANTRSAIDGLRESGPPAWFVPVWLGGVSVFYLYSLVAWLAASRLKTRGAFAAPDAWREKLDHLSAALGLRRRVELLESCLAEVPVVIGYLRPVILLPLGMLAGLTAEQVEAVLIHELAHIRRFDYLVNVLQTLVEGMLFYHPAVWWTGSVMRREREHCCDDVVVGMQGDARGYAATLARLELSRGTGREPALAATGGNLMKRIHRLMQQPEGPRVAAPLVSAAILLVAASLTFAAWQSQTQTPPPTPTKKQSVSKGQQPAQPSEHLVEPLPHGMVEPMPPAADPAPYMTPYQKWLTQDVAYIITLAEREAFKGLQTDDEREHFIEQFWLVRDPTPGTIENEFKQEHYRRIAYANEHFSTKATLPGWKTDRGRIYITYGPPDEIEDHASGGIYQRPPSEGGGTSTTVPFQDWRYKFIEGVGNNVIIEFVDPNMAGEYRMTMDPQQKEKLLGGGEVRNEFAMVSKMQQLRAQAAKSLALIAKVTPLPVLGSNAVHETYEIQPQSVSVSFPIETNGHPASIRAQVVGADGHAVANAQDKVEGVFDHYSSRFTLLPGSYRATVEVQDRVTGELHRGETAIEVK